MRSEKAKMLAGDLYVADCPELAEDNARANAWMDRFNARLSMPVDPHEIVPNTVWLMLLPESGAAASGRQRG
jgi:Maltose acetyltransferase